MEWYNYLAYGFISGVLLATIGAVIYRLGYKMGWQDGAADAQEFATRRYILKSRERL